jgi:phosphohistidine phosphatase SixA
MKSFIHVLLVLAVSVAGFAQESGKIFLVRHAEKQSDDADTPLSAIGLARANCLAQTLKDAHIKTALVTQYQRTMQTADPTVKESNAKQQRINAQETEQIVAAAKQAASSGNVLIVGHSNTVPSIVSALGGPAVTIPDTSYDQLFILNTAQPIQLTVLHYCPALPTDTAAHPANSMAKP